MQFEPSMKKISGDSFFNVSDEPCDDVWYEDQGQNKRKTELMSCESFRVFDELGSDDAKDKLNPKKNYFWISYSYYDIWSR